VSDLILSLRSELNSLEAELAADPRYQKIAKIQELLAIYDTAPSPIVSRQAVGQPESQSSTVFGRKPDRLVRDVDPAP
jgi:hypothetical protein